MFSRTPLTLALAPVLSLSAPLAALAQSNDNPAGPATVVITGARAPEPLNQSVRPVQVLDAQAIAERGVSSLPELLATLGGVEAVTSGGLGQMSSVFIRGANSSHTVVLVDGVRIGSATSGTAALESIPLALIERVEVLPGAASSLYGADAIGGVIQVFTRGAGSAPGSSVAATLGSHGTRQLSVAHAARLGETRVALGANLMHTDGINATTPANAWDYNADRDGALQRSLSASLTQPLGRDHEIGLRWLRSDGKVHFDDGPTSDSYADTRTQTLAGQWTGTLAPQWRSELRVARAWDESTSVSNYPGSLSTTQDQLSWLNHLGLGAGQLSAGLEWLRQQVDSSATSYSAHSRDITGALLGWRARYGALAVQADARYDDNSQFGGHATGQLGAAWQVDAATRLRASVGTAFKAPTFNDLYAPAAWGSNPALQPERSTSLELGADWRAGASALHATLFDNRIRGLIASDANFVLQNIHRAETRGLTLGASTALDSATQLRLNLSVQDPRNLDTDALLLRRARVFGDLQLTRQMGALRLGSALHFVGGRDDMNWSSFAVERMGGYGLLALFGSWQFQRDWSLEGRVDNLADKSSTQAIGYATPGRSAQLTLRWTPKP